MNITDRSIRFLFTLISVKGWLHKSVVHKLYALSTASIILFQDFKNYLCYSGTGNRNWGVLCLYCVFFFESAFIKYKNNENLIQESSATGTDAAYSGTLISLGEIFFIACVVSYVHHTGWRTKCHTIDCTHNTSLLLQKHLTSGTELILIGWKMFLMKVFKLSIWKESTLYQSVHENVSESLLHSLFLHKTIQLSPFDLQSTARCPQFYKLVTSIAFSVGYSIHSHVCNIDSDVTILMGW